MKKIYLIIIPMTILLTGCEWIGGLFSKDIGTDLTVTIPVDATAEKSALEATAVSFSASETLSLEDNRDLEDYLDNIKNIDLKSLVVTVNGLGPAQVLNTISIEAEGVGVMATYSNITAEANSFTPDVDKKKLTAAADKLLTDKKLTFTVNGTISGPLAFFVRLTFDAVIKAGL